MKKRKLNFSKEELKIEGLEQKSEIVHKKLDKAKTKTPTKKIVKKVRFFDEKTQKSKTKFTFEKENISINEAKWNNSKKKAIPQQLAKTVSTTSVNKLHSKVYEVEDENVGTQSVHKAELMGESAFRNGKSLTHSAYRFAKNTPYRDVSKLEMKSIKIDKELSSKIVLRDNPQLKTNSISRFFQKRNIKKQYVEEYKKTKNSAKTVKKTGDIIQKISNVVVDTVRKNPTVLLCIGLFLLIIFMILSLFSMCGMLVSGSSTFINATTYAVDENVLNNTDLVYTEWETDLKIEIQNVEITQFGYDEYQYNIGEIGHDPFELMGFLTAVYGEFTDIQANEVLQQIFSEQYNLSYIQEIEIRTRIEMQEFMYVDPYTSEIYTEIYEVEVEYEWYILNVNLDSISFSDIIYSKMNEEQLKHYEILMQSKGNRQYVANPFKFDWSPYVSSPFGYRLDPMTGEKNYHRGIDIGLPIGTEVCAGFDGKVTVADYDVSGFGYYVVIEMQTNSGDVIEVKYAHCDTLLVHVGQTVSKGDIIATVGNTGNSTGSHLHLEILKNGEYQNPIYFAKTN